MTLTYLHFVQIFQMNLLVTYHLVYVVVIATIKTGQN